MKTVVITGSNKGIGRGLAQEFLKRGYTVVISGRNPELLQQEVKKITGEFGGDKIMGHACDVTDFKQVQALWDAAKQAFGTVDIWINNAGITCTSKILSELDPAEISPVVTTNITGLLYGCQVSLRGMIEQGSGHIYNMEGYGSDDSMMPGVTLYGTTKRAVRYITESLIEEAKDTPVRLGTLRPGMVITDLLLNDIKKMSKEKFEEVKPIFNALADKVETITPFLVENILKNDKTGTIIEWLSVEKANARFADENYLSRDMFSEYGL